MDSEARMTARARADRDDAVDPLRRRFFGVPQIDHIVEHQAAVAVHRCDHFCGRRRLVMMMGTLCFTHMATSCSTRSLLLCTI